MEKHDETGIEAHPDGTIHEVSQYKCLFNRFDENGDGKISPAELRQCMEAIGEKALAKIAEKVVDILDTDRDGLLGFDNFVMFLESQKFKDDKVKELKKAITIYEKYDFVLSDSKVSQYERVFNHFDENGDGKISLAELRQCVEAIGVNLSADEAEVVVAFQDTDGDGFMGFDDFVGLMERWNEEDKVNDLKEAFEMYDEMDNDFVKFFGRRAVHPWIMRTYKSALVCSNRKANRATGRLPISWNDLKKPLHQKPFLFTLGNILDISPQQHGILLMLFGSILSYLAKNSTTPFEFGFEKTTNTPQSLLSLDEAFYAFIPEMAHITMFIICYIMTWMLVLPLRPGLQIFLVLLLISAPLFYFPELVRKASTSGIIVTCGGSFKLPLIGFTTLAAFGITLIFGLVALLVVYLNKRFIHGTPTRGQDIEVTDGLLSVMSNV